VNDKIDIIGNCFDICDFGYRDESFGESRESFFELHDACNTLASKHVLNDLPSLLGSTKLIIACKIS
jgi:hypothetical protein